MQKGNGVLLDLELLLWSLSFSQSSVLQMGVRFVARDSLTMKAWSATQKVEGEVAVAAAGQPLLPLKECATSLNDNVDGDEEDGSVVTDGEPDVGVEGPVDPE
jgi:hypothetical protein